MERFLRTELLIGKEKFKKLQNSFVTVIGLGAVGSYVTEALARAGIGHLRVVDFDQVKPSNINRNILALDSTVGKTKTEIAKQRILDINPDCSVEAFTDFFAEETVDRIFDEVPDMLIDAIDSLNPKIQLLAAAYGKNIPVISSMGAATRTDPFLIRAGDLFTAKGCPLAFNVRKKLRKKGIKNGIFCIYSEEEKILCEETEDNEATYRRGRKRKALGSLPTITGIFGLMIAHHAIKYLCGGFKRGIEAEWFPRGSGLSG